MTDTPATLDDKLAQVRELLARVTTEHGPASVASSLGVEDMLLTDLVFREFPDIQVFTLDTGRLPAETYDLLQRIREHYGRSVLLYFPQAAAVESYAQAHGPNGFYDSVEARQSCCHIRKVEPLQRALADRKAWITGMRRAQSATRQELAVAQWDADHGLMKFNPLLDWSEQEVWAAVRERGVPYNALHDRGYPSIGCAPCTRAITVGEDIRAGRWWWENPEAKECGLHVSRLQSQSR